MDYFHLILNRTGQRVVKSENEAVHAVSEGGLPNVISM
jgi:hypothetical protein